MIGGIKYCVPGNPATVYTASTKTFVTTTPQSRQVTSQIDANGKVLSQSITGISPISFSYDTRGRTSSLTQGTRSVSLSYDTSGNLSCVTDPLSRTVNFAYDPNGRVTSQTFPDGRSAGFTYDANGNVLSVTPPGKPAHSFTYTPVDLQATYTPPDIGIGPTTTTYSYNGDRQLTRVDRPDSKSIAMSYDGSGRLSTVATPEGTTSLTYDGTTGQLTTIANPDGITTSYSYDGFLPLTETWAGNVSGSIARTFNNDFQLSGVSVNGGTATNYTYDNDGLLTGVDGLTLTRNSSNGLLTGSTLGNVTDTYTYNSFGEVSSYTAVYPAGLNCQISYTRDAVGRITGKTEDINTIVTNWGYTYDLAGRLTQTTKNGDLWASYGYDTNGNRTLKTTQSGSISGTYDAQDRLLTYGNYVYTYSANGELETKTNTATSETTAYTYDVLGNLRSVLLPDGTLIDYIIDGRNRRVGKKVNGTLQRQWIYDGQLRPVAEYGPTGTIIATYVYATHINVPDFIIRGASTYRVITDHLGSLRFAIDTSTGNIAQRMDYDDWGNVLVNTAPDFTPFGFAGGLYDSQTKLTRFGARDYDAECGRWTAKDPILFKAYDYSLYNYVKNDSINGLDSTGLSAQVCIRPIQNLTAAVPARHCYIWFSDGTSLSYDPEGIHKDPNPYSIYEHCYPLLPEDECGCTDKCLREGMPEQSLAGSKHGWTVFSHNCCDAVRSVAKDKCHCKIPFALAMANAGF
ncbi:MAG TPA: RHS repeat-associated core domain-containing protein [Acidobacteriota bacterium]|nr:RHS repeat-associated core domain-containing protein [Acidobacteriota bacterium]HQO18875.1 RHS repeat-associated core domain-containing protein [Acidobacteriota bacterium]HQQ46738.1 RHS repeat-associated core domain-containing protein [Acidobacteriota bacterium]